MGNLKKFVGEYAYNIIKNMSFDDEKIRQALITPQNAREVFSELIETEIKSLCSEICSNDMIGQVRETTQQEIIDAFKTAGYDRVIFDDESAIYECKKYYEKDEVICTYNNLRNRMNNYHMLVAIKSNIEEIKRSETPRRDDEYGTSILNVQIERNGTHMSIKNRYNHTVSAPDATLNNNLDLIAPELQRMVLGYYGFASLHREKLHFRKIVNIGDVYLKYHTEKNNIYFGTFTLDGVNGARYTDASRYYVFNGLCADNHYRHPLVFDFKTKKVIDVIQEDGNISGKILGKGALLSRAMREGTLTSKNRNEADAMVAVFPNAKKELLQSRKNALKFVHDAYGHDFTKPYTVTGFLGKFTAKSIETNTGSDTGILLMFDCEGMKAWELNKGKFNAIDKFALGTGSLSLKTFCRKYEFEDARKRGYAATYVIQQKKEYINKKPKCKEKRDYLYYPLEYDKGGYNLSETKIELYKRLAQYKKEKRAKEASETDFSQEILSITKEFSEFKEKLIEKVKKADTCDDYIKLSSIYSCELAWLVNDIKVAKENAENKSFSSVKEAEISIRNIKATISKIKNKIS